MENQEKQNVSEPHVKIFNEEVKREDFHHHHHHGHSRSFSGWLFGLIVLFIGVVLLLNNFGVVDRDVWNHIWQFWPVLLIIVGIRIILK